MMLLFCWTQQEDPCLRRRQTEALASGISDTLTPLKRLWKGNALELFPVLISLSCLLGMALSRYYSLPDLLCFFFFFFFF